MRTIDSKIKIACDLLGAILVCIAAVSTSAGFADELDVRIADSRALLEYRLNADTLEVTSKAQSDWPVETNDQSRLPAAFEAEARAARDKAKAREPQGPRYTWSWTSPSNGCGYVAGLRRSFTARNDPYLLEVQEEATRKVIWSKLLDLHDGIADVAWSADDKRMFVLIGKSRISLSPLGILGALSGHPQFLVTYRVLRVDLRIGSQQEQVLVKNLAQSHGRIVAKDGECPGHGI